MVTDPVCLSMVDERTAAEKSEHRGQTYCFDSERCRRVFESDPDQYVGAIPEKVFGDHGRRGVR